MNLRRRSIVLTLILAVVVAGCSCVYVLFGKTPAFIVTSLHPADYCTALLSAQDEIPVFISRHMEEAVIWEEVIRQEITDLYVISEPGEDFTVPDHVKASVELHLIDPTQGDSASVQIADLTRRKTDTVLILDEAAGIDVAGSVCAVSAYRGIPILLTDAQSLSPEVAQFIKDHRRLAQAYVIGDTFGAGIYSELEALGLQVFPIPEADTPYINGVITGTLAAEASNLTVTFRPDEMLSAALQCSVTDTAVLFVPEVITDSQEIYLATHSFSSISTLTAYPPELLAQIETIAGRAVERPFSLEDTGCEGAVFYIPHQDDETLFFSQVIAESVAQFGAENVYAVLISDGSASVAQRREPVVGYLNGILDKVSVLLSQSGIQLSESDRNAASTMLFSQARTNECLAALRRFGVTNVEIFQYPDGELSEFIPQIQEIISSYEADAGKGNLIHFTYSPYYDLHSDHRAIGQALLALSGSGNGFQNVQFIVKNEAQYDAEFMNAPDGSYAVHTTFLAGQAGAAQIRAASDEYGVIRCNTEAIAQSIAALMIEKGCTITEAILQSDPVKQLRLSIGVVSVGESFDALNLRTDHGTRITTLHGPFSRSQ